MSMSYFTGEGNIGSMELRRVPLGNGEQKPVLNLSVRVNVDRPSEGEDGKRTWEDKGGRWFVIEYWGKRGQMTEALLQVGARVVFGGQLSKDQFPSRDNPDVMIELDKVRADFVAISPICLESVTYKAKRSRAQEGSSGQESPPLENQEPATGDFDDDIPY